jgi:glycosyltransferase involved in cell wall biosynthesis
MGLNKIKILVLAPQYLPGYQAGGPIRSVANLFQSLGNEFEFKIITSDRDLYSQEPYKDIPPNEWLNLTNAVVFYASPKFLSFKNSIKFFRDIDYDILYLNSFFHPVFSIRPILLLKLRKIKKTPVILAPRGEFSSGALSIKGIKKLTFVVLAKLLRLYRHVYWQASNEVEKNNIQKVFKHNPQIFVAPNIPPKNDLGDDTLIPSKEVGSLKIVFLSRISPIKNLDGALSLLNNLDGNIRFDILGPIGEESYWKNCQSIINKLKSNIVVKYRGSISHEKVKSVLRSYHILLLPTFGENFGHVILESLGAGLPVIISDRTPWHGLSDYHAGFDIPIKDTKAYHRALNNFIQMDSEEYNRYRKGAMNYANAYVNNSEIIDKSRQMFKNIYSKSK